MLLFRTLIEFFKNKEYQDLILTTTVIIGFGSVMYRYLEGWTWLDAIYFSIITLTTVGYGDFSPQTDEGKIFTIFYIFIGIGIILSFVNTVYHHYSSMKTKHADDRKKKEG